MDVRACLVHKKYSMFFHVLKHRILVLTNLQTKKTVTISLDDLFNAGYNNHQMLIGQPKKGVL